MTPACLLLSCNQPGSHSGSSSTTTLLGNPPEPLSLSVLSLDLGWCLFSSFPIQHPVILFFIFILFFCFLGLHLQHMEIPSLWVKSRLQLLVYTTATAPDLSRACDLHHSSPQCRTLHPLSEARNRTHILMDTSQIRFHCITTGTPNIL